MAMNPMQRRSRNMFFLGFLLALVIMVIVVLVLVNKMKEVQKELSDLKNLQSSVLVASRDLESGTVLSLKDDFVTQTVQTKVPVDQIISNSDFIEKDSNGNDVMNEDGEFIGKDVMLKVNVPSGAIVTKDMLVDTDDPVTNSDRIQEYNMILLPSQLKNGDYVDIRIALASGQDFIVLTKKRVLGTTGTSLWIKVNETEIQILNSAIIESYLIDGAKLYAITYSEAGMQPASTQTYTANAQVLQLLESMAGENGKNLVDEIREKSENEYMKGHTALDVWNEYNKRYNRDIRGAFEDAINASDTEGKVAAGVAVEKQTIREARQEFISELEGTDEVGYNKE